MNKYLVFVNLDNILKEKYLESYLKDGYELIYSDDNSLSFRLGESKLDKDIELNYIRSVISTIKRMRIKRVIIIDITEEMNKATGKIKLDGLFIRKIKNKVMKEMLKDE